MSSNEGPLFKLRVDAYDADQYRGVIGAAKPARAKAKADSDAAIAAVTELVAAARAARTSTTLLQEREANVRLDAALAAFPS
jgi:hypothetical protein